MRINKDGIFEEDKEIAVDVLNKLRSGIRVILNPAQGLKETLKKLEEKRDTKSFGKTDWLMKDADLEEQISKLKAGIKGEEELSDYLSTLLKYDEKLNSIVAFASLSAEQENNNLDYIPDSDFVLVCGRNILIIDAKNISTKADMVISLECGVIMTASGKELLEVHLSTHIWRKLLPNQITTIDGYVCIVNKTGCEIDRNEEWYSCDYKLIHISELQTILEDWVSHCKDDVCYLKMLTDIAKTQVRKEKSGIDLSNMKHIFGV